METRIFENLDDNKKELIGHLMNTVEDWLTKKGFEPEDIPGNTSDDCLLCGSIYDELAEQFAIALGYDGKESHSSGVTYVTPAGETRSWQCPNCGHEWLEFCDSDQYPDFCPECAKALRPSCEDDDSESESLDDGMKNLFTLTLGDSLYEGHEQAAQYIFKTNASMHQLHCAYFDVFDDTGIDLEKLFDDKDYLTREELQMVRASGWSQELFWEHAFENDDSVSDQDRYAFSLDELKDLWAYLIQKADPSIKLEEEHYPDFHTLDEEEQAEHGYIGNIGYAITRP